MSEPIVILTNPPPVIQVSVTEEPPPSPVIVNIDGVQNTLQVAYHHVQSVSSNTWSIEHDLGFYPNVTTMDSGGSLVEGEISHVDKYHLRVTFSAPISGQAFLS